MEKMSENHDYNERLEHIKIIPTGIYTIINNHWSLRKDTTISQDDSIHLDPLHVRFLRKALQIRDAELVKMGLLEEEVLR